MLDEAGVPYRYRDYRQEPLSAAELRRVLKALGIGPQQLLRRTDKVAKELGLTGSEPDAHLIRHMAAHPTLIQRPIAVYEGRAVVGRPPEAILALLG